MCALNSLDIADPRWLAFVSAHPAATPFHGSPWIRLLSDCYSFQSRVVTLLDEQGAILAGAPFVEVGRGARRRWIALPFTDRCSPLAADERAAEAFVAQLAMLRIANQLRAVQVRDRLTGHGWTVTAGHWHTLHLTADPDELRKRFHKFRIRALRRAEREKLTVSRGQSKSDLCQTFYQLHVLTRRRLGVPVQPRRFFELLWDYLLQPGHGYVLIARLGSVPVASAVYLSGNCGVTYKFGASDRDYASLGGGTAVMWEAIRHSCKIGARAFDFGRTEEGNEGLRAFKLSWGAHEERLDYTIFARNRPAERRGRALATVGAVIRHSPPWVAELTGRLAYRFTA